MCEMGLGRAVLDVFDTEPVRLQVYGLKKNSYRMNPPISVHVNYGFGSGLWVD